MKYLFAFLFLLISIMSFTQGIIDGFLDNPKTKNLAFSFSRESADIYYLGEGVLDFEIKRSVLSIYYKQQINKWLGLAVNIPFVNFKPQDGSVYLKAGKQLQLSDSWSVNGFLGIGGSHPLSDYNTESSTAIGQQTKAIHFRALTQLTYKNQFFINGRIGQNLVQSPTPSSGVYSIKMGYYKNKWYADVWFEKTKADGGKDYRGTGDLAADNFRQLGVSTESIGGVIFHQTKEKLGLFLGFGYILNGRNAFKTSRVSVGLVLKI